jgi:charged multivesicular body protein 4
MMDDIAEQQEVAREISDAISNPLSFGQDIDDDELERELEELEQQKLDEELLKVGPSPNEDLPVSPEALPNVPAAAARQPRKLASELF